MINISAHIAAANSLRAVKGSIDGLVSTLRSAQNNIYQNEVPGLDSAITQLEGIISDCLAKQGEIDGVASSIVAAAIKIYNEELAALEAQRLEAQRKKRKTS